MTVGEAPRRIAVAEWSVALLALGLLPGLYQVLHPDGIGLGPGYEMAAIARSLVEHGIFGDPFRSLPTGPTATSPPLYPLFLALCIRVFKSPVLAVQVILLANAAANALAAALLPSVSMRLWRTPVPGIWGGVLSVATARLLPAWDASFTQVGLILFCLFTTALQQRVSLGARSGMFAGASMGALFQLSQPSLMVTLPWTALLLATERRRKRACIRFLASLAIAALAINMPWLARNYSLWGQLVTRTNFGYTFGASNNDCAESSLLAELNSGCHGATHPDENAAEAARLREMGEPAYDRARRQETWAWISTHPSRFWQLTGGRIVEFWFPALEIPFWAGYAIWGITILSLPGMVLLMRERSAADYVIFAVFLLYPLPYYVVISSVRYRTPVLWLTALVAGRFAASVYARWSQANN